jgi:hypothetical protein
MALALILILIRLNKILCAQADKEVDEQMVSAVLRDGRIEKTTVVDPNGDTVEIYSTNGKVTGVGVLKK